MAYESWKQSRTAVRSSIRYKVGVVLGVRVGVEKRDRGHGNGKARTSKSGETEEASS